MLSRQFISKIFAFAIGLLCVYTAYEFNSKSNTVLNGSIYGTSWNITSSDYIADHHLTKIKEILNSIDYIASNYKDDSEVAHINKKPLNTKLKISSDLEFLISTANTISKQTNGLYDITLGKISASKGFAPNFDEDLTTNLSQLDNKFDIENNNLIKYEDFWFDLSSIAKGYAVQKIHDYLKKQNLNNHLIDIVCEIIISGMNRGDPWKVGIQNPDKPNNNIITTISNRDLPFIAIATSGEYRNYRYVNGEIITHTINPNTNKSIDITHKSITVISINSATRADAYATALNVMGYKEGMKFANKYEIPAMYIINNNDELKLIKSQKWYDLQL